MMVLLPTALLTISLGISEVSMEPDLPLHTKLFTVHRHRVIHSSDEEEVYTRQAMVSTRSDSAPSEISNGYWQINNGYMVQKRNQASQVDVMDFKHLSDSSDTDCKGFITVSEGEEPLSPIQIPMQSLFPLQEFEEMDMAQSNLPSLGMVEASAPGTKLQRSEQSLQMNDGSPVLPSHAPDPTLVGHPAQGDAAPGNNSSFDTDTGIVISMMHSDNDAWDTDLDGTDSDTSTPDYKCGGHSGPSTQEVVHILTQEAKGFQLPTQERRPSLHLLADARISNWPSTDKTCVMEYHPQWKFKHWIAALRAETVRIQANTVVLYLEETLAYEDVPPLKNNLHTMCKTIRQHCRGARIFIANLLPQIQHSLLGRPRVESNFTLLQAIRNVNRALSKTHYLSVYEHFVSNKGKVIRPLHKYFQENDQLTNYGCLILRECLLCEAGLKTDWF